MPEVIISTPSITTIAIITADSSVTGITGVVSGTGLNRSGCFIDSGLNAAVSDNRSCRDDDAIIGLTRSAILSPTEPYEFNGIVPNVTFPAGFVVFSELDEIRAYYGCADTSIGLATGCLSGLLKLCKERG